MFQTVLLSLTIILIVAKFGGHFAHRVGQSGVLAELIIGIALGNLGLFGIRSLEFLKHNEVLEIFSELGVVLLLFEVGLETTVSDMAKVGLSSFLTAVFGVVAPFLLGWAVSSYFLPDAELLVHAFVGATLTATSVGITARVLKDIGKIHRIEARIILGAAVIDDVLGLVTLAVVSGVISAAENGGELTVSHIGRIIGVAVLFFVLAVVVGRYLVRLLFSVVGRLRGDGLLLSAALIICFSLSFLTAAIGLAPIVGAFAAGLILEPAQYQALRDREGKTLEHLIHPLVALFAPVFFVLMGAKVDLAVFGDPSVLGFAVALSLAAIIGKQVCGFGVLDKGADRIAVGLGMIPRGEVGLIFAAIGAGLTLHGQRVIDNSTYGAVVIMVLLTTLLTPPLLAWRFKSLP